MNPTFPNSPSIVRATALSLLQLRYHERYPACPVQGLNPHLEFLEASIFDSTTPSIAGYQIFMGLFERSAGTLVTLSPEAASRISDALSSQVVRALEELFLFVRLATEEEPRSAEDEAGALREMEDIQALRASYAEAELRRADLENALLAARDESRNETLNAPNEITPTVPNIPSEDSRPHVGQAHGQAGQARARMGLAQAVQSSPRQENIHVRTRNRVIRRDGPGRSALSGRRRDRRRVGHNESGRSTRRRGDLAVHGSRVRFVASAPSTAEEGPPNLASAEMEIDTAVNHGRSGALSDAGFPVLAVAPRESRVTGRGEGAGNEDMPGLVPALVDTPSPDASDDYTESRDAHRNASADVEPIRFQTRSGGTTESLNVDRMLAGQEIALPRSRRTVSDELVNVDLNGRINLPADSRDSEIPGLVDNLRNGGRSNNQGHPHSRFPRSLRLHPSSGRHPLQVMERERQDYLRAEELGLSTRSRGPRSFHFGWGSSDARQHGTGSGRPTPAAASPTMKIELLIPAENSAASETISGTGYNAISSDLKTFCGSDWRVNVQMHASSEVEAAIAENPNRNRPARFAAIFLECAGRGIGSAQGSSADSCWSAGEVKFTVAVSCAESEAEREFCHDFCGSGAGGHDWGGRGFEVGDGQSTVVVTMEVPKTVVLVEKTLAKIGREGEGRVCQICCEGNVEQAVVPCGSYALLLLGSSIFHRTQLNMTNNVLQFFFYKGHAFCADCVEKMASVGRGRCGVCRGNLDSTMRVYI